MALPQNPPTFTKATTGSKEYSLEINDANFETKAWKLPRYEGSKTITHTLNRYSNNDVTFGKTAAVQKYSRNIYIGNSVIGMDDGGEDVSLVNFPAFSYITTNRFFTINSDGTITDNQLEVSKENFDTKRGFYRSFYEDFPIGNDCKVFLNDDTIKSSLKERYPIYFNGGQLQSLLQLEFGPSEEAVGDVNGDPYDRGILTYTSASNFLKYDEIDYQYNPQIGGYDLASNNNRRSGLRANVFNEALINKFFSGSLRGSIITFPLNSGKFQSSAPQSVTTDEVDTEKLGNLLDSAMSFKSDSEYKGDKRFFISYCYTGSISPIRTTVTGSYPSTELTADAFKTELLSELSTLEIQSHNISNHQIHFTPESRLRQHYVPRVNGAYYNGVIASDGKDQLTNTEITPLSAESGSVILSKVEDAVPSLLVNLPKNNDLPDGTGNKSFIVIPENLHPHIKRNLTYFLAQIGLPLGIDKIPAIDDTFEKLK